MANDAIWFDMGDGRMASFTIVKGYTKSKPPRPAWRAVVSYPRQETKNKQGSKSKRERLFGNLRELIPDAVVEFFRVHHLWLDKVKPEELTRIKKAAYTMHEKLSHSLCSPEDRFQCAFESTPPLNAVRHIHQIYGLFGDGEMSAQFKSSQSRWQTVAKHIQAKYILWTAEMLDSLVKQRYPDLWEMYDKELRYPVMRCDIGRILILHAYGGLYSDLDVLPNKRSYPSHDLALQRVTMVKKTTVKNKPEASPIRGKGGGRSKGQQRRSAKNKQVDQSAKLVVYHKGKEMKKDGFTVQYTVCSTPLISHRQETLLYLLTETTHYCDTCPMYCSVLQLYDSQSHCSLSYRWDYQLLHLTGTSLSPSLTH